MTRLFGRALALGLTAVALVGCALPKPKPEPRLFDLGGLLPKAISQSKASVSVDVRLPPWLDRPDMAYRMASDGLERLYYYRDSRWADRPSRLLNHALRDRVSGQPNCRWTLDLAEFAQHFADDGSAAWVMQGRWVLTEGGRERAAGPVHVREAAGRDVSAGARAVVQSLRQLEDTAQAAVLSVAECRT